MADSRRESVVAAIKTALDGITTANGYETNIGSNGFKWKGSDWIAAELPGFDLRDVEDNTEAASNGGSAMGLNREDHKLQIEIHLAVATTTETDKVLRKAIADVYKRVGVDRKFGLSYVRTTWPRGDSMGLVQMQNDTVRGGALVRLEVIYSTKPFDPYN